MSNVMSSIRRLFGRRWKYALMSVLVALGLIVATPQISQAQSAPRWLELLLRGAQIIQLSTLSDRQEVALGQQINQQLTAREFRLFRDRAITDYVNQVGQRLVPQSDRPNIPYTFQVVDDTQVNAFATMGGFVYITTGLIRTAENEAQLASVLGHEIGHIAARHAVEQMRERAIASGVASVAGLDRNQAVALGVELALSRPNSRRDEFEADEKGLENVERAGYAPNAVIAFLQKLLNQRARVPSFLSTHPATSDRIERLEENIDPRTGNRGAGLDTAAYRARVARLVR